MESTAAKPIKVRRRLVVTSILMPLIFGFLAFMNVLDPGPHHIRRLDVVRLMALGAFFGLSTANLVYLIRSKFRKDGG